MVLTNTYAGNLLTLRVTICDGVQIGNLNQVPLAAGLVLFCLSSRLFAGLGRKRPMRELVFYFEFAADVLPLGFG